MLKKIKDGTLKLAVIGLGYVGLPLAVEFGKKFCTVGFDKKASRLDALKRGVDETLETSAEKLLHYSPEILIFEGLETTVCATEKNE